MVQIKLPPGWTALKQLFDVDPNEIGIEEACDRCMLTEDIWWTESPERQFVVDLGWYPQNEPDGFFKAVLIEKLDWNNPREEFTTHNYQQALRWIQDTLNKCQNYLGAAE